MTANSSAARVAGYFDQLAQLLRSTRATNRDGQIIELSEAFSQVAERAVAGHADGNRLFFLGNGGSAGIASHLAIDYSKNGHVRALALNDGAALTCLGNDFGFEHVFAKQLEFHARSGDCLIAISSSGQSENILNGVRQARELGLFVVTLSGFEADNPLSQMGDLNFYVGAGDYGFVEVAHLALCHSILDLEIIDRPR